MNIFFDLIQFPDPNKLPKDALPGKNLFFKDTKDQIENIDIFKSLIDKFNIEGDCVLNEIFTPLLSDKSIKVTVIVTQGIPEPYDAWSAVYKGEKSFFFNLSLWSKDDLNKSGLAVIKHEITHVLLHDLIKEPDKSSHVDVLEYITIHEGLAHYIGFFEDRSRLLTDFFQYWEPSEKKYTESTKQLKLKTTPSKIVDKLIYESNTGSYWDKYAAISGMFRIATIHKQQGIKGIIECINNEKIPKQKYSYNKSTCTSS